MNTRAETPSNSSHAGAPVRGRRRGRRPAALVVVLVMAACVGCARTSVEDVRMRETAMPRPDLIIVHDFAVSPEEVALDRSPGSRLAELVTSTPEADAQTRVGREVASVVAEKLVKEIQKLGMPAVAAASAPPSVGPRCPSRGSSCPSTRGTGCGGWWSASGRAPAR